MVHNSKQVFSTSIKKLGEMRLIHPRPPKKTKVSYTSTKQALCLFIDFDIWRKKERLFLTFCDW
jgi:hypothetical protein